MLPYSRISKEFDAFLYKCEIICHFHALFFSLSHTFFIFFSPHFVIFSYNFCSDHLSLHSFSILFKWKNQMTTL